MHQVAGINVLLSGNHIQCANGSRSPFGEPYGAKMAWKARQCWCLAFAPERCSAFQHPAQGIDQIGDHVAKLAGHENEVGSRIDPYPDLAAHIEGARQEFIGDLILQLAQLLSGPT